MTHIHTLGNKKNENSSLSSGLISINSALSGEFNSVDRRVSKIYKSINECMLLPRTSK